MSGTIRGFIRLSLGIYHTYFMLYAYIWDIKHPNYQSYAGRWKTLTFLTCMLNCWYFIGAMLQEFVLCRLLPESVSKKTKLFLDGLFGSVVCPAALLVVAAFWGLFFYNRDLIWPAQMDEVIPHTYGHMMHSTLGVFAIVELIIFNHQYLSFNKGLAVCMMYAVCYVAWLYYIRYAAGIWVYPLFYRLTKPWKKEMFICGIMSFLLAFYCIQNGLHHAIHGNKQPDLVPEKKMNSKVRKTE